MMPSLKEHNSGETQYIRFAKCLKHIQLKWSGNEGLIRCVEQVYTVTGPDGGSGLTVYQ